MLKTLFVQEFLPEMRRFYGVGIYFGIFFGFVLVSIWIGQTVGHICKIKCLYENTKIANTDARFSNVLVEYVPVKRIIRWVLIPIIGSAVAVALTWFCFNQLL